MRPPIQKKCHSDDDSVLIYLGDVEFPSTEATQMKTTITADVIVIGGSLTGLLAALATSAKGLKTIVIERGSFSQDARCKFVPQSEHIHLLLMRGERTIDGIVPGIFDAMRCDGALRVDQGHGVKLFDGRRWRQRFPTGVHATYFTRTLLQKHLQKRVGQQALIQVLENTKVRQITFDLCNEHAEGVIVYKEGHEMRIDASLVIDASGRTSKLPQWLHEIGVVVDESHVKTNMGYVSQRFTRPESRPRWDALLSLPRLPEIPRMAAICSIENNQWQVTAGGWRGNYPDRSSTDLRRFLAELPVTDFVEAIDSATPVSDVSRMCISGSRWRHFERCHNLPSGVLVVGDSLCSLNPLYSQGMTIAALHVGLISMELERLRARRTSTQQLQIGLSALVAPAWAMAPGTGASVKQFDNTASPGFTPAALSATNIVEPQEFKATQYLTPSSLANSTSSADASLGLPPTSP